MEERWTRAHNMMRSVLLAETAKERKVDKPAILEARGHLEIIRRKVLKHGLSPALQGQREKKQKELLRLERPEIKPSDPETAKRMADQSDKCTRAMFQCLPFPYSKKTTVATRSAHMGAKLGHGRRAFGRIVSHCSWNIYCLGVFYSSARYDILRACSTSFLDFTYYW